MACGKRTQPTEVVPPVDVSTPKTMDAGIPGDGSVIVLPPHADTCTRDAECGVTSLDLDGPQVCCFRCCSMHGGRKDWVDAVEATCKAKQPSCTPVACACPSPPYKPKCAAGRCTLVY